MKFKRIKDGQQAVIYNVEGQGRTIEGPNRVFLFRERLVNLRHYFADQRQYLVIRGLDGRITHKPGPCAFFMNPLEQERIDVRAAVSVSAGHQLVVYRRVDRDQVVRRVVDGPAVFFPTAEEWLEEFSWHGSDPNNQGRLIPGSRQFTQLPTTPEHFYYNVRDVRTTDDTMMQVKLMVTYQIKDVVTLLESTQDPISDMINAICADVIALISKLTYAEFVACTSRLSSLDSFPELLQRASRVGLSLHSVVFRGYHASDRLQEMHNRAIEARTQLRLRAEVQSVHDKLASFKLDCERKRMDQSQDTEQKRQQHAHELKSITQEAELARDQLRDKNSAERAARDAELDLELCRLEEEEQRLRLEQLKQLDVDLTSLLVAQVPARPQQQICLQTPAEQLSADVHGISRISV